MTMKVRFWGVRGSIATPGPDTARVGGNTSCVEIEAGDTRLVLDAGSGARALGNAMLARGGPVETIFLLSHVHWDHIQGIPFFAPIFVPGSKLHFVAGQNGVPIRDSLRAQMRAPHFPVDFDELPSSLTFADVRDRARFSAGDAEVAIAKANHPDAVYAYRVTYGGRSIVYATDTEHYACVDPRLEELARGADVLIYDAQYLPTEYAGRAGWGHSTWEAGVELARAADVGKLLLFHHDPSRDDRAVEIIEERAREAFDDTWAAREGMVIDLDASVVSVRDAA